MALHSWSLDLRFGEKKTQPTAVSTGPSLELCTVPSTLGSSVAASALEQLFAVEQSLQSDYFKCNEEARIFLNDIAVAVKKLEEMRKATIDLLEIESMEFSRLYFILETLPDNAGTELEECVRDARRLNLFEISQLQIKILKVDNEIKFLKKRLLDLKERNKDLGEEQEELAKEHEKFVLSLNHTMEKKAATIIYINQTYTKIKLEGEELKVQAEYSQDLAEETEKERAEYLKQKRKLSEMIDEYKKLCEFKRRDTYGKKKGLDKLRLTETEIKETVTTQTVVLSDHNLEIAQLHESIRDMKQQIEELEKACLILEDKTNFFLKSKEALEEASNAEKNDLLQRIKEIAEKLYKDQLENKDLQDKLYTLTRQHKIVLQEEDKVFMQYKKIHDENKNQLSFIAHKENFLAQRKVDIKNMEEGLVTLTGLNRAAKEAYAKQIKVLVDNLERERQRCIVMQWKVGSLKRNYECWLSNIKAELQLLLDKIQAAEARRLKLLEETNSREKEITEYIAEIEKITADLKQEEKQFIIKEKKLVQELKKYEQKFVEETETTKLQEDELVEHLPHLQMAEESYRNTSKIFDELNDVLTAKKHDEIFLRDQISQMTRETSRSLNNMDKVKQELKQLRDQESNKLNSHFEIVKNLENEIYCHDLITDALLLENKRLKEYIAHLKSKIAQYAQREEDITHVSSGLSWQLITHHTRYLDVWAEFQITIKAFVNDCKETLQEIKNLIEKLRERDGKVEHLSIWLQGNLEELHSLTEQESTVDLPRK
ncbi:coiled-coil domain-containing protein 175 [Saccopteryx leptura]|uniref:coiled-coil domain-containing protein 175 n=1 Tax=Saccopteryx leptura TaxID=249018 RepID=UPI00339CFA73